MGGFRGKKVVLRAKTAPFGWLLTTISDYYLGPTPLIAGLFLKTSLNSSPAGQPNGVFAATLFTPCMDQGLCNLESGF
jgi:hypothetical protein